MPPTFVYLIFLVAWAGVAVATWIVAAAFAVFPEKRRIGFRLASAMAGTIPGVIVYQVLATPIVAAVLLAMRLLSNTLEPGSSTTTSNPTVIILSIIAVGLAFVVVLAMSITGFWEGWRLGWTLAAGENFVRVIRGALLVRIANRVRGTVFRPGAT